MFKLKHKYRFVIRNSLGYTFNCIVFGRSEEKAAHYWCKYIRHPGESIKEIIDMGIAK